jgi:hypothetical protein
LNRYSIVLGLAGAAAAVGALAGEVTVVDARATPMGSGTYRFEVTLEHADTGWDHYADRWDVVGPNGDVLGSRTLYHPHVDEQPFTRSLSGVRIPKETKRVDIRAHDSVHGDTETVFPVELPAAP